MTAHSSNVVPDTLTMFLLDSFLYPLRLMLTMFLMSQLHTSSCELLSVVSRLCSQRVFLSDEEERRVSRTFLERLKQIKLAASPSDFYKIKPSVFLTLLSLIVTYTIILLQTNDGTQLRASYYINGTSNSN